MDRKKTFNYILLNDTLQRFEYV